MFGYIGGIHDAIHRRLWPRAIGLCGGLVEVTADGFDAASMLLGQLFGGLFAFAVALPKGVGVKASSPYELPLTADAAVLLFTVVTAPVFLDLFGAAKKAFFVFRGFDFS